MANDTLEKLFEIAQFVNNTKGEFVHFGMPDAIDRNDQDIAYFKTYAISDGNLEIRIRAAELDGKLFIKYIQASPRDGTATKKAGIKIEGREF